MDITITIDDEFIPGLQFIADRDGHADIAAVCYAPVVERAKVGLAEMQMQDDAAILAAVKADPEKLASVKASIEQAVSMKPIRTEEIKG